MSTTEAVARYYDGNTRRFLRFSGGGATLAIHRPLWGPGVSSAEEAADYVHLWLLDELRALGFQPPLTLVDLGCGVGGTLFRLGQAFPGSILHGVTISDRQVAMAQARAEELELAAGGRGGLKPAAGAEGVGLEQAGDSSSWHFHHGDFHEVTPVRNAHVVVAIEAFAHSTRPETFLASAARQLREGGVLVVVDDFLARPRGQLSESDRREVEAFQLGWRLGELGTMAQLTEQAVVAGFNPLAQRDFSGLIRLDRLKDRGIGMVGPMAHRMGLHSWPFFGNLVGGNALRAGLKKGNLRYGAMVLQKGKLEKEGPPSGGQEDRAVQGASD